MPISSPSPSPSPDRQPGSLPRGAALAALSQHRHSHPTGGVSPSTTQTESLPNQKKSISLYHRGNAMSDTHIRACIEACLACFVECERCASACLDKGQMADCVRACRDCADLCSLCAAFMARGSKLHPALCKLCAEACVKCAEECGKHAAHHAPCKTCAEACRKCAETCAQCATHCGH